MGDTTISTKNTEIYYPSDWLIEGGPPFETMNCPQPNVEGVDQQKLEIIYNDNTKYFGVVCGGFIVMESKDVRDLATYVGDYAMAFRNWVQENEAGLADGLDV